MNKRGPADYFFLYVLPVLFLVVAWWGITSLLGPSPPVRAVSVLKKANIQVGMPIDSIIELVGKPDSIESYPDGTLGYVWHQGGSEAYSEDEATLTVNGSGFITRVRFERVIAPANSGS